MCLQSMRGFEGISFSKGDSIRFKVYTCIWEILNQSPSTRPTVSKLSNFLNIQFVPSLW